MEEADNRDAYVPPTRAEQRRDARIGKRCAVSRCGVRAAYGAPRSYNATHCAKHAPSTYVIIEVTHCAHRNCDAPRTHGVVHGPAQFCARHAPATYVDVTKAKCEQDECSNAATHRKRHTSARDTMCHVHAPLGYVHLCEAGGGCKRIASHAPDESKIAEFCEAHAPNSYVCVRVRCKAERCRFQPFFGAMGDDKPSWCLRHARPEHVDVVNTPCQYADCDNKASYGPRSYVHGSSAIGTPEGTPSHVEFCLSHAPENYTRVRGSNVAYCARKDCWKRATRYAPDKNDAEYCGLHAPSHYTPRLKARTCLHPGCDKQASHTTCDGVRPVYCGEHAPSGYISQSRRVCSFPECESLAHYAVKNGTIPEYCMAHAPPNYFSRLSKRCHHKGCQNRAFYSRDTRSGAEYCHEHAPVGYRSTSKRKLSYVPHPLDEVSTDSENDDDRARDTPAVKRPLLPATFNHRPVSPSQAGPAVS